MADLDRPSDSQGLSKIMRLTVLLSYLGDPLKISDSRILSKTHILMRLMTDSTRDTDTLALCADCHVITPLRHLRALGVSFSRLCVPGWESDS